MLEEGAKTGEALYLSHTSSCERTTVHFFICLDFLIPHGKRFFSVLCEVESHRLQKDNVRSDVSSNESTHSKSVPKGGPKSIWV